ncbi:MAG: bifunctional preprotein translocase subunit SecD/SecF [Bacteroidetes bacterium OLB11]|nr:MAG: bifunctional preprotein translocase subunit SecD/SecF [Bacteroidetes bacterium OLB11]
MQLKGLIKLFTIALILISLYQLSFTFAVRNFEKKQAAIESNIVKNEYPDLNQNDEKFKNILADKLRFRLDSLTSETIYNLGFKKFTYQEAKEQELNLGLDLQGGMNVVLEVSIDELVLNMSNNPKDPALLAAIAKAKELKINSQKDFVSLFADAYQSQNPNAKMATLFANPSTKSIDLNSNNDKVISYLKTEEKNAIIRTHRLIGTRIDKFGVAQPNVS